MFFSTKIRRSKLFFRQSLVTGHPNLFGSGNGSIPSVHSGKAVASEGCRRGRHRMMMTGRSGQRSCPVVCRRHGLHHRWRHVWDQRSRWADGRAAAVVDVDVSARRAARWGLWRVRLAVGWRHKSFCELVLVRRRRGVLARLVTSGWWGQRVVVQWRHLWIKTKNYL